MSDPVETVSNPTGLLLPHQSYVKGNSKGTLVDTVGAKLPLT